MTVTITQPFVVSTLANRKAASQRLLATYAALAARGEHLLNGLLEGDAPLQWRHYPENDAIDSESGYQWFYHSHSPDDRAGSVEHGHFHLFARRSLWSRRLGSSHEKEFSVLTGLPKTHVSTRHLIAIGMDHKGIPINIFTVNSWVTGDLMLSASLTEKLLAQMRLNTGHPAIDAVLECVMALCPRKIHEVLAARDLALKKFTATVMSDNNVELLSEIDLRLEEKLLSC